MKTHSMESLERSTVIVPGLVLQKAAEDEEEVDASSRSQPDTRPVSEAKPGEKVELFLQKVRNCCFLFPAAKIVVCCR